MNNNDIKAIANLNFVPISDWIPVSDAYNMRRDLVNNGTFTIDQVGISPFRWVDRIDYSKGRVCRVLAIKGLHPDLEVETIEANSIRVKKAATATAAAAASGNSIIGGVIGDIIALAIIAVPLFFIYRVISFWIYIAS